jgi:hypothetical protein
MESNVFTETWQNLIEVWTELKDELNRAYTNKIKEKKQNGRRSIK